MENDCEYKKTGATTLDHAAPLTDATREEICRENALLNTAIHFATDRHAGQLRKGTGRPYILHPLETMQILSSMRVDTNLMIAGLLHDIVEDTDTRLEEIIALFGEDVGELVRTHSQDMTRPWIERKTRAIEELKGADFRFKMLVMADKVSNLRGLHTDLEERGEELWQRFRAPKEKQAWYYGKIRDALREMQDTPRTNNIYQEMLRLYDQTFSL